VAGVTEILALENLSKWFGGVQAIADVSFSIEKGTINSLIGPNGAGKTTVFNIVSALYKPSAGAIRFNGKDITGIAPHRLAALGIGRTFQNNAVFRNETVISNIVTGMHHQLKTNPIAAAIFCGGVRSAELAARRRAEEIIEFLEIEQVRDHRVGSLSYGLQKRVELGRALAVQPSLLLLDEMVSGMNSEETEDIGRFVLDLKEELGLTVLMIEHDMGIVMDISDKIFVMNNGCKIAEGAPSTVSTDAKVIAAYLGREDE
jgi:branched-chain amino acid transport system ATP-binding protein